MGEGDEPAEGRTGSVIGIRVKHIKEWLVGMKREEEMGEEGEGDTWWIFVPLIRSILDTGTMPRQIVWMKVALLPKGGGDFRGFDLLEPFWKLTEGGMYAPLK